MGAVPDNPVEEYLALLRRRHELSPVEWRDAEESLCESHPSVDMFVELEAVLERERVLFDQTGNVVHVFAARRLSRWLGWPYQAWTRDGLEQFEERLMAGVDAGSDARELARTIGLWPKPGGRSIAKKFETVEREWHIVSSVLWLEQRRRWSLSMAIDQVATDHGLTSETVQTWYYGHTEKDPEWLGRRLKRPQSP